MNERISEIMNNYNSSIQRRWEVRIVDDNNNERFLARCKEKKECYQEMTFYLKSQGFDKKPIRYHEHPCDKFLSVTGNEDTHFRIYEV